MLSETIVHKRIPGLGCFVSKPINDEKTAPLNHIWDVILYFYNLKTGKDTTDAPVRKLSQSFKLDHVGGRSITSKQVNIIASKLPYHELQVLLTTIENIISTHAKLKRSKDAHWKAFVSAAMNEKKLPAWLRIIFRTRQVVEMCYNSWSYVARTGTHYFITCHSRCFIPGCEELYTLLEDLHKYSIHLPVDLALRPFEQIKDAFWFT